MTKLPANRLPFWGEAMVFGHRDAPVTVQRLDEGPAALHRHSFTELVFVTAGTCWHRVNRMRYRLTPGDYFVIPRGCRHAYTDTQGLQLINVLIRRSAMSEVLPALHRIRTDRNLFGPTFTRPVSLGEGGLATCLRLVERIEFEAASTQSGAAVMQQAILLELLVTVCRLSEGAAGREDAFRARIDKVLEHMEKHLAEPLTLAGLEALAHMSARSFQRHFHTITGMQPMRYLQQMRLLHACRLLASSDRPVYDVAAACGYPDTSYFCGLFHRRIGISPKKFQNEMS